MLYFVLSLVSEADQARIEAIYELCQKDMLRYAAYIIKDQKKTRRPLLDAEDIVQEVWVRISQKLELIGDGWTPAQIKAYMLTAVKNEALFLMKRQKETVPLGEAVSDEDFLERIWSKERYQEVVAAIKAINERYSIPLFCYFIQERSIKEIATILHLPVKTVYTRIARGKELLLEQLKGRDKNG